MNLKKKKKQNIYITRACGVQFKIWNEKQQRKLIWNARSIFSGYYGVKFVSQVQRKFKYISHAHRYLIKLFINYFTCNIQPFHINVLFSFYTFSRENLIFSHAVNLFIFRFFQIWKFSLRYTYFYNAKNSHRRIKLFWFFGAKPINEKLYTFWRNQNHLILKWNFQHLLCIFRLSLLF